MHSNGRAISRGLEKCDEYAGCTDKPVTNKPDFTVLVKINLHTHLFARSTEIARFYTQKNHPKTL